MQDRRLFGNTENKEKITLRFQKGDAYTQCRLNLALSRDSKRPLYAKDASHVISRQMCGTACLFRTNVCNVNTVKSPSHTCGWLAILSGSTDCCVYVLNFLEILHEVVNIRQTWLHIGRIFCDTVLRIRYVLKSRVRGRATLSRRFLQ